MKRWILNSELSEWLLRGWLLSEESPRIEGGTVLVAIYWPGRN